MRRSSSLAPIASVLLGEVTDKTSSACSPLEPALRHGAMVLGGAGIAVRVDGVTGAIN